MNEDHIKKTHNIHEIQSISEIKNYLPFNAWLVFDLDNTLIEPLSSLGSDQWFCSLLTYANTLSLDQREALFHLIAVYDAVQMFAKVQCVEETTRYLMELLVRIGFPILGLTSRGAELVDATQRQLKDAGLTGFFNKDATKNDVHLIIPNGDHSVVFSQNIIYCNGQDKGQCLAAFLKELTIEPKHIVMIDDKHENLRAVNRRLKQTDILFTGLRYSFLDGKINRFNLSQPGQVRLKLFDRFPEHVKNHFEVINYTLTGDQVINDNSDHYFYEHAAGILTL